MATLSNETRLVVKQDSLTFNEQPQKTLIKTGEKSLKTNRFMTDEKIRGFIDEFFGDWDDVKTTILVMKTYQVVDSELKRLEENGKYKINIEERRKLMIGLIKEMMTNSECRQELVRNMNVFMGTEHGNCRKLVEQKTQIKDNSF